MKQEQQTKHHKTAAFVGKLRTILSDPDIKHIVSWENSGLSFSIHNLQSFESSILPKYFRHNRYSSFVRQLNMYGFHKIRTPGQAVCCFQSEHFTRDYVQPREMIRKHVKPQQAKRDKRNSISTLASLDVCQMPSEELLETTFGQPAVSLWEIEDVQPIEESITRLVSEVKTEQHLLDSDLYTHVNGLLSTCKYKDISRRFLPFIMECLGAENNQNSQYMLCSEKSIGRGRPLPEISSFKLI